MEMQKTRFNINFMEKKNIMFFFSGLLLIISIISLFTQGLNLGIDFTGGNLVEISYAETVDLETIRDSLESSGFDDAVIQYFGTARDILIRVPPQDGLNMTDLGDKLLDILSEINRDVEMKRLEFVGPQVGEELKNDGGLAMIYALLGILIYIAMRFQMRFSAGAIAALVHDIVITLGFFSITRFDFDLTVLAALLAVIGYSLNDTIVVFDRIRENFRKFSRITPTEVFNISINQTLSRTLITSLTTLLVLIALFIFGGANIHSFAIALIIGVLIGTYSSIFIASPITLQSGITKEDLMPVKKEGSDL